jgi:hypothetical protein
MFSFTFTRDIDRYVIFTVILPMNSFGLCPKLHENASLMDLDYRYWYYKCSFCPVHDKQ